MGGPLPLREREPGLWEGHFAVGDESSGELAVTVDGVAIRGSPFRFSISKARRCAPGRAPSTYCKQPCCRKDADDWVSAAVRQHGVCWKEALCGAACTEERVVIASSHERGDWNPNRMEMVCLFALR
jgi:hypothetical protein